MKVESSPESWDQLRRITGAIPWPALYALAAAAATDADVVHKLFDVFDRAYEDAIDQKTYADLYVPAIFALAAPRLDDAQRREIGSWVVKRMIRAARDDADLTLEALENAAGTMGPVTLPAVLDAIAEEPDMYGAWFHLWGLTGLAAKSDDAELRERVARACVELLEKADRGEAGPGDAVNAAWTLGSLQRSEHAALLQRLIEKAEEDFCRADYEGALGLLQGHLNEPLPPESWEEPVEEWLTSKWKTARKWFAERAAEEREEEEEDEEDEEEEAPFERQARLLPSGFAVSPVATALPRELLVNAFFITERLVYHSLRDLHVPIAEWNESALRELLLVILPRNLPARRDLLVKMAPVTEAFLYWLGFEGILEDADALAAMVHDLTEQIVAAGMDRQNWGTTKTLVMEAMEAGLDVTDPQVRRTLTARQLDEFVGSLPTIPATEPPVREEPPPEEHVPLEEALPPAEPPAPRAQPPIPIVERPNVARNAPCPCGSGRKYKKCHGRSGAQQTADR